MRVNLAAQVLSASVASVLKAFGPPEAAATAQLCEMVDKAFDCLNVRSTQEHFWLPTHLLMIKGMLNVGL